jgi:hypothetical protein
MPRVLGSIALAGVLLIYSPLAQAQSDEQRANARALADQGAQAFSEQRWQDAIDLFERAESLIDAPTHLLFGARAHAQLHHYVKARELYLRIIREQLGPDAPRAFLNAQASANQELGDIGPHIGQLTIAVRGADPKLAKVTLDGAAVQSVLIGVARPIDPGSHRITAEAPGFAAQSKDIVVTDAGKASVVLELVPGDSQPAPSSALAPETSAHNLAPVQSDSRGAPSDVGTSSNGKRIAAYTAFGVGAVGLGVGAAFWATSASKRSQADQKFADCGGPTGCTNGNPLSQQVTTLDNSARSAQALSIVGFAVGGLAASAGVVLFVLSQHHEPSSSGVTVVPRLGLGSAGVTGTF